MHCLNQQQISMGTRCGDDNVASTATRLVARQLDPLIRSCVFVQGIMLPRAKRTPYKANKNNRISPSRSLFHSFMLKLLAFSSSVSLHSSPLSVGV